VEEHGLAMPFPEGLVEGHHAHLHVPQLVDLRVYLLHHHGRHLPAVDLRLEVQLVRVPLVADLNG